MSCLYRSGDVNVEVHLLTLYETIITHDKKSISVNSHVYLDSLVTTSKKHTSFLKTLVKYMTNFRKKLKYFIT